LAVDRHTLGLPTLDAVDMAAGYYMNHGVHRVSGPEAQGIHHQAMGACLWGSSRSFAQKAGKVGGGIVGVLSNDE
jgi:hypothetical protein